MVTMVTISMVFMVLLFIIRNPVCRGCKSKRQRVQWDPQRVQLHPVYPPDYGSE